MQTEEIRYVSFVESVCHRPKMYTINGTLEEVLCFLEGYYSGNVKCSDQRAWQVVEDEWYGFTTWSSIRLSGSSLGGWRNLYDSLRQIHAEDATVLEHCAALCAEYHLSRTKSE